MRHEQVAELARWQRSEDARLTRARPELLARRVERMCSAPLAFLRGSIGAYHRALEDFPSLSGGPAGQGWIVGDLHVENFGAWRSKKFGDDDPVVFDLNDLDAAALGPWSLDLLRLSTSLFLALQARGRTGRGLTDPVRAALWSWREAVFDRSTPPLPALIERMVAKVAGRSRREFLDDRTQREGERRRFQRGVRYLDLERAIEREVPAAFARYADGLERDEALGPNEREVHDAAFRVAGTGSLGVLRVAVLVRAKGDDGDRVYDMKEQGEVPATLRSPVTDGAERVLIATRSCLARQPRQLGATVLAGRSMVVRRLSPQEDKLDLARVDDRDLSAVTAYLGALAGAAHRRGVEGSIPRRWSDADCGEMVDRSVAMAGLHTALWMAYCGLG